MIRSGDHRPTAIRITLAAAALAITPFTAHADTRITIERLEGGAAQVGYALDEPAEALVLRLPRSARTGTWHVDAPFEIAEDRITSAEGAFRDVTVTIAPDTQLDGHAPALVPLNDAVSVLNLDYVRPAADHGPIRLSVRDLYDPVTQACVDYYVLPRSTDERHADDAGRYLLIGNDDSDCRALRQARDAPVFSTEDAPAPLVEAVTDTFTTVSERLASDLGIEPALPATLMLTHDGRADGSGFAVNTGWQSTTLLRFWGDAWGSLNAAETVDVRAAVAEALARVWLGGHVRLAGPEGSAQRWLEQGAAEYIALVELERLGLIPRPELERRVENAARGCALGSGATATGAGKSNADCGVLVQFVYDALSRVDASNPRTVLELWRSLLASARGARAATIAAGQFFALNATAHEAVARLIDDGLLDLGRLAAGLERAGVGMRVDVRFSSFDFLDE